MMLHRLITIGALLIGALSVSAQQFKPDISGHVNEIQTINILGNGIAESVFGFPDVMAAYSLANPRMKFTMGSNTGPNNRAAVELGQLDLALTSGAMGEAEALTYPNVTFLPIMNTAIVPVYRLDSLQDTLILSAETLAYIYAGKVTSWDDIRIRNDNPGVSLPHQPITVVWYNEARYITDIWIRALNRATNNDFIDILPTPKTGLSWPKASYAAWSTGIGITGVAAMVVDTDGSIGYCIAPAAVTTGARISKMKNIAGGVVTSSTLSVSFAVSERSIQSIANPLIEIPDMNGCTSVPCWPIVETIFLFMENNIAPHGCSVKSAMVEFMKFFYASGDLVTSLLAEYQMTGVPEDVQKALDVAGALAKITCNGLPLESKTANVQKLQVAVPDIMLSFMQAQANFFRILDSSFAFTLVSAGPGETVRSVQSRKSVIGFYSPQELEAYMSRITTAGLTTLTTTTKVDTTNFMQLPMYLSSVALVYNPVLTVNYLGTSVSMPATSQLVITADLLAQVMLGEITSWHDSKWLELNSFLPNILNNASLPAPVSIILGCMKDTEKSAMTSRLFHWLTTHIVDFGLHSRFTGLFSPSSSSGSGPGTAFWNCQKHISLPTIVYSASETSHQQLINSRPGSLSFIRDNVNSQSNKFALKYRNTTRVSSFATIASCMQYDETLEALNFDVEAGAIANTTCWPLSQVLMAHMPRDFGALDKDAWRSLSWLQSMVNSSAADYWSDNMLMIRIGQDETMLNYLTSSLYTVVSNGETVLIKWPILWELSPAIFVFGTVFVALIALLTLAGMTFIVLFRNYKTIRSNSPMFMCLSLFGIFMLLACIQLLVASPTDATCGAVNWMANLGFQVTFMPLFAKAWRIYRIFGGRKLQVVKINNRKLAIIVAVGLTLETLFLIVWQAAAPPTALTVIHYENNREHHYVQCGYEGTSLGFFVATCVVKLVLVLFGVRMAFGTRQVSDEFSESKSIAVAIYNVILAVGLIAALILLMDTVGDTLILLLVFCAIWVSLVTLIILVVPRVLALIDSRRTKFQGQQVTGSHNSSTGEYSFMSLGMLNNMSIALNYLQSLEHHIADVKAKLAGLRAHATNTNNAVTPSSASVKQPTSSVAVAPKPSPSFTGNAARTSFASRVSKMAATTSIRETDSPEPSPAILEGRRGITNQNSSNPSIQLSGVSTTASTNTPKSSWI